MIPSFYISELRITGENVQDAVLFLKPGLNYITGPSNTGKSYIYQCIDYVFGAEKIKQLVDFKDYTHIFLEITTKTGEKKTLMRKIGNSKILLYNSAIAEIQDLKKPTATLNSKASKNREKYIGEFVFSLLGLTDVPSLLKGVTIGTTTLLSLRQYLAFFFVDETKIISDKNNLLSDPYNDTILISIFRYILTGKDDSSCVPIERPEIRRAKIEGRIEMLNIMLSRLISKEDSLKKQIKDLEASSTYGNIEDYQNQIIAYQSRIDELTRTLSDLQTAYSMAEQNHAKESAVMSRLQLLKEQYESDLERLRFTADGMEISQHVHTDVCPLCHSKGIAKTEDDVLDNVEAVFAAESQHTRLLLDDLMPVIEDSRKQVEHESHNLIALKTQIDGIDKEIQEITDCQLSPLHTLVQEYGELLNLRKVLISVQADIMNTRQEIDDETEKLNQKGDVQTYKPVASPNEELEFCATISEILKAWQVNCESISLYADKSDFYIDERERISNGKGYRALYYAAFIYAIHQYLDKKQRNCFPCIMLDSPLTTLRGTEKASQVDPDAVNGNIQTAMLSYVGTLDSVQSIILENKEIAPSIEGAANVIRFSGSKDEGRFGLFPV